MKEPGGGGCVMEAEQESRVGCPDVRQYLLATKQLHPQEGKDNDEQEEEEQQTYDGLHGVEEGDNQVSERCPVPADRSQGGDQSRVCTLGKVPTSSPHQRAKKPQNLLCDFENTQ